MSNQQRLAPNSQAAEEAVLGSILINPDVLHELRWLKPEDFYYADHRLIFVAMCDLGYRGDAIDIVTLQSEMESRKDGDGMSDLAKIGGTAKIAHLINGTPTHVNAETYAHLVHRMAIRRRLLDAASAIAQAALTEDMDTETALARSKAVLDGVTEALHGVGQEETEIADLMAAHFKLLEERYINRHAPRGVTTGLRYLDALLGGGLQNGEFTLLGGRPGMGKTAFMLHIALSAARSGVPVLVVSLEMDKPALMDRLVAMCSGVDSSLLRTGSMTEDQWGRVVDATAYLDPLPIAVSDVTRLTPSKLRSICRRRKMSGGVGLVIVDYLQLMTPEVARENRVQEVSALSREAKLLAREMHVPVLMLCQLSRAVEGRGDKRPQLSDLRESGSLEQDADVVAFLYREGYYDRTAPGKETEVIVAKNRNGPPGTVQVMFTPETNRFAAIAKA